MKTKLFVSLSLPICVVSLCLVLAGCASSNVATAEKQNEMSYSHLKLMDLDQLTEIMQEKAKIFRKTNNVEVLQQGLEICLSRPNEDGAVDKVISIVKNPLDDNDAWESSIEALVDKSLANLKGDGIHPSDQVTSGVVLENIISEFKPDFVKQYKSPGFETRIIERIADADVEFSKAAVSERKLNLMRGNMAASAIAQKLIDQREDVLSKTKE